MIGKQVMRYPSDQKAKAKAAIIEAGARVLKQKGFNGVGVDALAASAGATSGAFYSNFAGKEDLLKEVIELYLGNPFIDPHVESIPEQRQELKSYLQFYVSGGHRDDPASGCVMPTLTADVARSHDSVRQVYEDRIKLLVSKMAPILSGSQEERERKAWTIVSIMVGSVSIARAVLSKAEAAKIIGAALSSAIALVDQP